MPDRATSGAWPGGRTDRGAAQAAALPCGASRCPHSLVPGRATGEDDVSENVRVHASGGGIAAPLWFAAWLFTIGYLKLSFWKAVAAFFVWAYFLGNTMARK